MRYSNPEQTATRVSRHVWVIARLVGPSCWDVIVVDTRTAVQERHATFTRREEAEVLAAAIVAAHGAHGKVGGAS